MLLYISKRPSLYLRFLNWHYARKNRYSASTKEDYKQQNNNNKYDNVYYL